jgi:ribosome-associated protein
VDTSAPRAKRTAQGGLAKRRSPIAAPAERAARAPTSKRAPLGAPKRAAGKREAAPEPSSAARELAVSIAIAGLDKKALAIEILDVTGKVDYADFLVVMTGRSDRHVHSIATGIEEALARKNKVKPLSVEGLATATWVLIDFGEAVVHVFQEDARRLYDIEGLWIDAGRVPLPEDEQKVAAQIDESEESGLGPLA